MSHCIHFGLCGGCAIDDRATIDKRRLLAAALERAGFGTIAVPPVLETPLRSRRRVDLAASRVAATVSLGLHAARSKDIVDMRECVLLLPELLTLVPKLRDLLRHLQGFRRGDVVINWLDAGPDILLRLDAEVTGPDRMKMIAFAKDAGAVRISVAIGLDEPEPVAVLKPASVTLSGVPVDVAPAAFLQASAAGETAIIEAVLGGLPKLKPKARLVELYAGAGTLSFALAKRARVEAYEGNPAAVAAHDGAIRRANLAGRMRITTRDLSRQPLKLLEMAGAAAVILDPPYAGAGPQMRNLAASGAPRIIYVSCNPEALAKDAYLLGKSGYGVLSGIAIDQFPFSENVESVVVFQKK